jgi:hypothetical protein
MLGKMGFHELENGGFMAFNRKFDGKNGTLM